MATLSFSVNETKSGVLQINARINNGSEKPLKKFTGYTIPANKVNGEYRYWDKSKRVVKGHAEAARINLLMSSWANAFKQYVENNKEVDIGYFHSLLKSKVADVNEVATQADTTTLGKLAEQFYEAIRKTHKEGTRKQYKTIKDNIIAYELLIGSGIDLMEIDQEFYKNFGLWLIEKEGNYNNTVNRKLTRIVTILNNTKYPRNVDYKKKYRFKPSEAARFSIWPQEMDTLFAHETTDTAQRLVLDAFLVGCETALRFSDITLLAPAHIHEIVLGKEIAHIIDITNEKTIFHNQIAISQRAYDIIKRNMPKNRMGLIFPIKWGQEANDIMKTIFKNAKLNRRCEIARTQGNQTKRETVSLSDAISFHMGRNTAITMQLSSGLPASFVKDNAGIKKMDTVMGYYRDEDERRWAETLKIMNSRK